MLISSKASFRKITICFGPNENQKLLFIYRFFS